MREGAYDYIVKPLTWKQLLEAIEVALNRHRALIEQRRHRSNPGGLADGERPDLERRAVPDGTVTIQERTYFGVKSFKMTGSDG